MKTKLYLLGGIVIGVALMLGTVAEAAFAPASIPAGGTGTTTVPSGQLLYGGSGTVNQHYQSVATTSATCTGSASCTAFTIIGSTPITINATGGSGGSGTVGTSTNETAGSLPYWTSSSATPALLGKVATTSLSVTGPITFSGTLGAQVGGGTGSFGCTTAASGVAGCLSNTSFDTFNNKQATISTTWPITLSGTAVGFNGLSTSTAAVIGNIPYFSGVNTFANIGTTTASCSGSTSCTSFTVLGSSPITISSSAVGSGLATTSPVSSSNVLVYSAAGAGAAYGVATTSLTATGVLSLSQPVSVIGSSASTLSIPSGGTNTVLTTNGIDVVGWTKVGLASQVSGTLPYANGGTGTTTAPQGQLLYGGATAYQSVATSSFTPSAEFTIGGTLGALVGGANSTLTLATNGVALSKLAQVAANSILGNSTGGTANVTAFATSTLGIALSDTTGTLLVGRGGTGLSSVADGSLLFGSGGTALTALASSTGGFLTNAYATGRPSWAATSTLNVALGDTTGTLAANRGGTGQSSYTTGDVLYASNSSTLTKLGVGTAGQVLGVVAGIPAWVATSTSGGGSGTVGSGTTGQFPFYNANGTTLTATSSLFVLPNGSIGVGTTTPFGRLSVSSTGQLAASTYLFDIASTTNADLLNVDATGAITANGTYFQYGNQPVLDTFYCTRSKQCIVHTGSDNTLSGVEIENQNSSSGASAYAVYTLQNELTDSTGLHYGAWSLNSHGYNDNTFGTGFNVHDLMELVNADGAVSFAANVNATTTANSSYFNWFINGANTSNEVARLTTTGLGIGTTTPWAKLSALIGGDFTAKAPSYAIAVASSSAGTATTTLFTVESSGKVSVPIELTTPYSATPTVSTNGDVGIDSTADQLKYQSSGATQVLSPVLARSFTYATSTWTGTTTYPIASVIVPYTFAKISCFTDAGTVNVDIYDGTNRTNLITASSTNGITALTTNNNMTAGKKVYVEMGTPATSPKNLACDLTYTFNAQ